jgi:hypothetical protein
VFATSPTKEGGVVRMSAYEGVSLMMEGALFVVSLISLIVVIVKAITGQKTILLAPGRLDYL